MAHKYAVLVGCNYPKTANELHGCVHDVLRMRQTLIHRFRFPPHNINLLVDTEPTYVQPTGHNIRQALVAMVSQATPGDLLFFHYSGHGTLLPLNDSKFDECIVPSDFNLLTDEDFRSIVNKVPEGATFTMLSDSCHSGGLIAQEKQQIGPTAEDEVSAAARPDVKGKFLPVHSLVEILRDRTGDLEIDVGGIKEALFRLFGESASSKVRREYVGRSVGSLEEEEGRRPHPDMGILLSGCEPNETSADANPTGDPKDAFGAFSNAIEKVLKGHPAAITNRQLVLGTRKLLAEEGFSQHACLYCSDRNADAAFLCQKPMASSANVE